MTYGFAVDPAVPAREDSGLLKAPFVHPLWADVFGGKAFFPAYAVDNRMISNYTILYIFE